MNELVFHKVNCSICTYSPENYPSLIEEQSRRARDSRIYMVCKDIRELSVVVESSYVQPGYLSIESNWNFFYIKGEIPFDEIGILSTILEKIKQVGVSILAISTYSTDYVFFKQGNFDVVFECLKENYQLSIEESSERESLDYL